MWSEDSTIYIQAEWTNKTASGKANEMKGRNRDLSTFQTLMARLLIDKMSSKASSGAHLEALKDCIGAIWAM